MNLTLHIWKQSDSIDKGRFEKYTLDSVKPDMSFLEMLDILNEGLICNGKDVVAFDYDCREGICGACSLVINGIPHGAQKRLPPASYTCGNLKTVMKYGLNPGESEHFRWCVTLLLIVAPMTVFYRPVDIYIRAYRFCARWQ